MIRDCAGARSRFDKWYGRSLRTPSPSAVQALLFVETLFFMSVFCYDI